MSGTLHEDIYAFLHAEVTLGRGGGGGGDLHATFVTIAIMVSLVKCQRSNSGKSTRFVLLCLHFLTCL
jgi:hypothetical protein